MKQILQKAKYHLPFLLLLPVFVYIASRVPYTHDDWDWGLDRGIEQLLSGALNNRYVGSFIVLVMTRYPTIKIAVMAVCMLLVPYLAANLATTEENRNERLFLSLLGVAVFTSMPAITWRQTYGWVSAFANFVVGAVFMLCLFLFLRRCFTKHHPPLCAGVFCFVLSLATQFFSENLSALIPFLLLGATIVAFYKKKARTVAFLGLLGSILGLVLMFYNPLYGDLVENGTALEDIRKLSFTVDQPLSDILLHCLGRFFGEVLPTLFETHPALSALLAIGVFRLFVSRSRFSAVVISAAMLFYSLICTYAAEMLRQVYKWEHTMPFLRTGGAIFICLMVLLALILGDFPRKKATFPAFFGALFLLLPFAALTGTGPRCYLLSHVLLLYVALSMLSGAKIRASAVVATVYLLALTLAFHVEVYYNIGNCTALRESLIEQAVTEGATEVVLPSDGERYVYSWGRNPQSKERAAYYREFYNLPEDLTLIFLPYGSYPLWPDIPTEMYAQAVVYP